MLECRPSQRPSPACLGMTRNRRVGCGPGGILQSVGSAASYPCPPCFNACSATLFAAVTCMTAVARQTSSVLDRTDVQRRLHSVGKCRRPHPRTAFSQHDVFGLVSAIVAPEQPRSHTLLKSVPVPAHMQAKIRFQRLLGFGSLGSLGWRKERGPSGGQRVLHPLFTHYRVLCTTYPA